MRIAFVSDTHGNYPALQAVLAELDGRGGIDTVVGGGDFAAGGAYPTRCVATVRELGWPCVRGNTEEWIIESASRGRYPAQNYAPSEMPSPPIMSALEWVARQLDPDGLRFLKDLPLVWRTTGPSGKRLVFVHATPWRTHPPVLPNADEATATRMLDEAEADTLVYGHIHHAYIRQVGERTLACCGAVGIPLDGDERPCCLIATDEGDGWTLEHVRVSYRRDAYLADLARSGLPNAAAYIETIRKAGAA